MVTSTRKVPYEIRVKQASQFLQEDETRRLQLEYERLNKARELKRQENLSLLEPYKTPEGYDIGTALQAGISEDVLFQMFGEEVVFRAKTQGKAQGKWETESQAYQDTLTTLEPFKIDETHWDVQAARQAGISEDVISQVFGVVPSAKAQAMIGRIRAGTEQEYVAQITPPPVARVSYPPSIPPVAGGIKNTLISLYPSTYAPMVGSVEGFDETKALADIQAKLNANPDKFIIDLIDKNKPEDAAALLGQFYAPEDVDSILGTAVEERPLLAALNAVPAFKNSSLKYLADLSENNWPLFERRIVDSGRTPETENLLTLLGYTPIEIEQVFAEPTKLNWRDKFKELIAHPEELLPFAGELAQASRFALLYQTAKMIKDGKTPSQEALQELIDFVEIANSEKDIGYQILDTVSQIPQFGLEILATLGTGGTAGVGAIGVRVTAQTAKQLLKSYISKAGIAALKKLLVAGTIQAAKIGVARVPTATIEKQLMATLSGNEESLALSVVKSMGENWVEVVSERTGGLFGSLTNTAKGALIKKGLFSAFIKANPHISPNVMQKALNKMQWHGVGGEWSEERIGDLMHGALAAVGLGDQPLTVPTLEQTIVELVSFSVPGAAVGIASAVPTAISEARLRPERGAVEIPGEGEVTKPITPAPTPITEAPVAGEVIFKEGQVKAKERLGVESNAYNETLQGIADVLQSKGIKDATVSNISDRWHYPLAGSTGKESLSIIGRQMESVLENNVKSIENELDVSRGLFAPKNTYYKFSKAQDALRLLDEATLERQAKAIFDGEFKTKYPTEKRNSKHYNELWQKTQKKASELARSDAKEEVSKALKELEADFSKGETFKALEKATSLVTRHEAQANDVLGLIPESATASNVLELAGKLSDKIESHRGSFQSTINELKTAVGVEIEQPTVRKPDIPSVTPQPVVGKPTPTVDEAVQRFEAQQKEIAARTRYGVDITKATEDEYVKAGLDWSKREAKEIGFSWAGVRKQTQILKEEYAELKSKVTPQPVKEPWQMTREEFEDTFWYHGDKPTSKYFEKTTSFPGGITRGFVEAKPYAGSPSGVNVGKPGYVKPVKGGKIYLVRISDLPSSIKTFIAQNPLMRNISSVSESAIEYQYEATGQVLSDEEALGKHTGIGIPPDINDPYKYVIEQALSEGKPVPSEVLKDNPDIVVTPQPVKAPESKIRESIIYPEAQIKPVSEGVSDRNIRWRVATKTGEAAVTITEKGKYQFTPAYPSTERQVFDNFGDAIAELGKVGDITEVNMATKTSKPFVAIPKPTPPVTEAGQPEVFPGITETKEAPVEAVVPPTVPPIQPPKTVQVPVPPFQPNRRNRIVAQSQEIVKQDRPGALNRLAQRIPGLRQALRFERPALEVIGTEAENLLVAQVAEVSALADVNTRQIVTRVPLFKQLHDVFGENVLQGEKSTIGFTGTPEQAKSPITGTLLDIVQNPQLYKLTPTHQAAIKAINNHNDTTLNYVVNEYGAEIGRFAPNPGGAFLSNVDVSEDIIEWLGSETRAIASGRGKTRIWATARDRLGGKTPFKPELDVKKLIEGMDAFKSTAAAGVTFKEVAGGLTRLEAMKETHPELYAKMIGLRKLIQKLQGYRRILEEEQYNALNEFLSSPAEDTDLSALQDALDVKLVPGRFVAKARAGETLIDIEAELDSAKQSVKSLRPAWKAANLKPYVFVQEGLYRYFPAEQAKYVLQSRQTTHNPVLRFIERWRAGAFSGDLSPFAIQGMIGVQADPIGSLQAFSGGVVKGFRTRDFTHSISVDGLMDDIIANPESFAEFSSLMGRQLSGTPAEYSAGFLSMIPGFDKFTETTYVTVTRGSYNLWNRTWTRLVESGMPEIEAKVAAIEVTRKVYPLVSPSKLGQSQKRAALLRAFPTSYSFIRQPLTLMSQASMGYAKFLTGQKLSPQERLAVRHVTTLAGSVAATSIISAVASALIQGKDDDEVWQAVLDAINPDPYNGKFLSVIIGDFRIPLGGPYRSIFRAIYPQEVEGIPFPVPFAGIPRFIVNRITPMLKTQINLLLNRDYYGTQIIKGEFPENLIRGLLYELEGAVPLSVGELMQGIRREEWPEDIAQQAAAQFVGVNLMKLNNTYFHKLVRNLGLPTSELPGLYSTDIPNFTTTNLYSKVASVLSDATLEEIGKRKGYPSLIKAIIEARDLRREVDLIPNHSPVSLNADPNQDKGITYKELYQQWGDRQELIALGDDAVYTIDILEGGRYKTRTYKGEDAVKAFEGENPQFELGNMSRTQFALLNEYWAITDKKKQAEFLEKHKADIGVKPRDEYMRTHPKENAQLAIWGQAKILTKEAYNQFLGLVKSLDIPDSAIPELTLPPEGSIDNYFEYQEMENTNSWEAQLMLANDDNLREFLGRQPVDTPIASLELKVKNRESFDTISSYSDKDSPQYIVDEKERAEVIKKYKTDNPEFVDDTRRITAIEKGTEEAPIPDELVNAYVDLKRMADAEGVGSNSAEPMLARVDNPELDAFLTDEDIWGKDALEPIDETRIPIWRIDVKWAKEDAEREAIYEKYGKNETKAQTEAINKLYEDNPEYAVANLQRDAYSLGVDPDKWVAVSQLPKSGSWQDRYYQSDPAFLAEVNAARVARGEKPLVVKTDDEIKPLQYDQIYEDYKDKFDKYEAVTGTADAMKKERQAMFDKDREFEAAYYRRDAYEPNNIGGGQYYRFPDEMVQNYVEYQFMGVAGWEQERYMKEHRDFYYALRKRNKLTSDELEWDEIPTEEVEALYNQYNDLPNIVKTRQDFRAEHLDLDAWMVLTKKVGKPITETKRRQGLSTMERLTEDVSEGQAEFEETMAEIRKKLGLE